MPTIRVHIASACPSCRHVGFDMVISRQRGEGYGFIATCGGCGLELTDEMSEDEVRLWQAATKFPPLQ